MSLSGAGWQAALEAAWAETNPQGKCAAVFALEDPELKPVALSTKRGRAGFPVRPVLVSPTAVSRRGLGSLEGRIALLHAIAHIEFNAINLALDAVLRFGAQMPLAFSRDWLSVAKDEARHFELLVARLESMGAAYGDLPAHDGLWEAAAKTADDVLARMALVPRVLEARGLDVTPGMIRRLREVGAVDDVACLEIILAEEVRHVAIGTHWYTMLCEERELPRVETFHRLLDEHMPGRKGAGPFNHAARVEAGFLREEYLSPSD